MGSFLAASVDLFSPVILFWSLVTAGSLQILSNLANDYGDSIHGADHALREGPKREVQEGHISQGQMKYAMYLISVISLISGIKLLMASQLSLPMFFLFFGIGILSIIAALLYTIGKLPYGYIGLGDLSVFIFFGLLGVVGTFYLHTGYWNSEILLPASACGLMAVAVLNINNIRDIKSDTLAGKRSIPVRLGREGAVKYHMIILVLAFLCALFYILLNYKGIRQFAFLVIIPLMIKNYIAVKSKADSMQLDPYLKQMAITTLLFVIIYGFSIQ